MAAKAASVSQYGTGQSEAEPLRLDPSLSGSA